MVDKIIVPYVKDDEHAAPKSIRLGAYPQIHLYTSNQAIGADTTEEVIHAQTKTRNTK
jgi:hypothetical protein